VAAWRCHCYQGKTMTQAETKSKVRTKEAVCPPSLFRVIYINDNQTTMEFVVSSLVEYFNYSAESAEQITIDIHEAGSAVVAVLPYEIAEQKGIEVTLEARSQSYPLQIKLEPEEVH
jgi:ATP-dependent Clp protease adaptor protein ClpS